MKAAITRKNIKIAVSQINFLVNVQTTETRLLSTVAPLLAMNAWAQG